MRKNKRSKQHTDFSTTSFGGNHECTRINTNFSYRTVIANSCSSVVKFHGG